jgi:glycosyltransferase involved in cell wall biosynthesis
VQNEILRQFGLSKFNYFFYPAQFWAHKNHYNLIKGFKDLIQKDDNRNLKLVLTGSDKGNKEYVKKIIQDFHLEKSVLIFGFVSNEEIYTLYKNTIALVMPTFLGPTNMPLLEARNLGTAVICSELKGHREMCLDGALYAEPSDSSQWCDKMETVLNEKFRNELIEKANTVRAASIFEIDRAIKSLDDIFIKYVPIRKAFD